MTAKNRSCNTFSQDLMMYSWDKHRVLLLSGEKMEHGSWVKSWEVWRWYLLIVFIQAISMTKRANRQKGERKLWFMSHWNFKSNFTVFNGEWREKCNWKFNSTFWNVRYDIYNCFFKLEILVLDNEIEVQCGEYFEEIAESFIEAHFPNLFLYKN